MCVCGTLLAFSCLSWTKGDSDEENFEFGGFGPCAATMRPEGPCKQEQDESTCPYLFSVPPLTFHLPKQLRELENIIEEVQKLKDTVDELRMMCVDCTVRQTDVVCAGQTERERGNVFVGTDGYADERKRQQEGQSEVGPNEFNNSSQTKQFKEEHAVKGDNVLENHNFKEREKDNWDSEGPSDRVVIKDERKVQHVLKKEGKTEGGRTKGREKSKPAAVPTAGESDGIIDVVIKKMVDKQSKGVDMDKRKGKNGKGHSTGDQGDRLETEGERKIVKDKTEGSGHPVWRDVKQGAENSTKTVEERGRDGIKMSKNPDKHTNKEREGLRQERKKEMEKGAKTAERNNKKPKQTESIRGMEKTIKEGDVRRTEKEIKTGGGQMVQSVQRDGDGELASRKVTERTDFASIVPTASAMTSSPSHSHEDLVKAIGLASPSPLSSSNSDLISSISQESTTSVEGMRIEKTDLETAVISEQPGAEENFMTVSGPTTTTAPTDTLRTWSSSGQIRTFARPVTTTSSNEKSHQLRVSSTVAQATFTTSNENFDVGLEQTGLTDHSTANKESNLMPNTNPSNKLLTRNGSVPGDQPASKLEVKPNLTKNSDQHGETFLPDQENNRVPKEKGLTFQPKTNQTLEPGKTNSGMFMTHQNQNSTLNPKMQQTERITDPDLVVNRMLDLEKSLTSTRIPLSHQTPPANDARDSGEDRLTEILNIAQDSTPEERPVYLVDMNMSGEALEIPENMKHEDKPESDENQKFNDHLTSNKPKNKQEATTGLLKNPKKFPVLETEFEKYASFGTEVTPHYGPTRPLHEPVKSSNYIPDKKRTGFTSPNRPYLTTDQQGLKPELDQMNQEFTTLPSEHISFPTTVSVLHNIFQSGADKSSGPFHTQRPLTQPLVKPGATSVQKSEPSLEAVPSLETETDSVLPRISTTTSEYLQKVPTDSLPTSGPVKLITDETHSAGGAEFNARDIVSLEPNSFGSGRFTQHPTLSEDTTTIPNSRVTSDPWPQTATQTPSIQMTTRPNRITLRTLPSNAPARVLRPTQPKQVSSGDPSQQVNFPHKLEETRHRKNPDPDKKMFIPAPSPRAQVTSTISPQLSSTKPAVSGRELMGPEVSTASTRELRVKINQVAAFFNNSVSSNGRHPDPDRHPKVLLEGKQGGGWPDGKLPSTTQGKIIYFGY